MVLGDGVNTDNISPVGPISKDSPAGRFLRSCGVVPAQFNTYGSRRGNHQVMVRGAFASPRVVNEALQGVEGGFALHLPSRDILPVFDVADRYRSENVPLVIIAGKSYGMGSARDWAAKGTRLLGVRAVVAESFERIHRSNLALIGVLPLEFTSGATRATLKIAADDVISIRASPEDIAPGARLPLLVQGPSGDCREAVVICRLDTDSEVECWRAGGILQTLAAGPDAIRATSASSDWRRASLSSAKAGIR
jgi:aconitate hydratase